jgi:hypothetical protein
VADLADDKYSERQDRADEHGEGQDARLDALEGPSAGWRIDKGSDTEERVYALENDNKSDRIADLESKDAARVEHESTDQDRVGVLEDREIERTEAENDARNRRISVRIAYSLLALAVGTVILLLWSNLNRVEDVVQQNKATNVRVAAETVERRDQLCTSLEGAHLDEVNQLRDTYRFIGELSVKEVTHDPLTRFVVLNITKTEEDARTDEAPDYCDEPGAEAEKKGAAPVGLPEPDPVVPGRPADVAQKILLATKAQQNAKH